MLLAEESQVILIIVAIAILFYICLCKIRLLTFMYLFISCVCMCVFSNITFTHMDIRGQLEEVRSLLPECESPG